MRTGVRTPHGRERLSALKAVALPIGLVTIFLASLQRVLEYAANTLPDNYANPINWKYLPALQWLFRMLKPIWGIGALSVVLMAAFAVAAAWSFIRDLIVSARNARRKVAR